MKTKREIKCDCCRRVGSYDDQERGSFPHRPGCKAERVEHGMRCMDCGANERMSQNTSGKLDWGCPFCNQRWDLSVTLDTYYDHLNA